MKPTLTEADFARAANALAIPVAAIKAVCQVEAPNGGFLPDGQVTILFERHKFSQRTGGRFDRTNPRVSDPVEGGYGPVGQHQHDKLAEAVALDREAALSSTSWGKFQIMGFNYAAAGFATLQDFITAMHESEGRQLNAFVTFIQQDRGGRLWAVLKSAVQTGNWAGFASMYNGSGFARNQYDVKLAKAFKALS